MKTEVIFSEIFIYGGNKGCKVVFLAKKKYFLAFNFQKNHAFATRYKIAARSPVYF